ncbi:MAG TPA: hypothetical protein DEU93_02740 [Chitinophagaceae bacterium]|nr:hypothetical protein [Chitinophagaceae bacterium]
MKWIHLVLSIIILFMSSETFAQPKFENDSVLVITYELTNQLPHFKASSTGKLLINGAVSYYFTSNPSLKIDEADKIPGTIKYADSSFLLFNQPMMPHYDKYTYFSDSLHPMQWTLTGKKASINQRIGYEATTFFRGRYFTAFYDPTIPFNNGPVKFGGLPGLIIRLYDRDKLWDYELKSIAKEPKVYTGNKIKFAGDYKMFLSIYPEWRRKLEEKLAANQSVDPNCPTCGSKNKHYSMEIY